MALNAQKRRHKANTKRGAVEDVLLRTFCPFPAQGLGRWCAGVDKISGERAAGLFKGATRELRVILLLYSAARASE